MKISSSKRRIAKAAGVALAALWVASPGAAQPSRYEIIASGESGRTYHDHYARNLISLMPAFRLRSRETAGSGENLDLLAKGTADIGFAQADIYAARLKADPKRYSKLTVIGRLTDECVYIAYRPGRRVTSFGSFGFEDEDREPRFEGRKPQLSVGPAGSGMNGTWSFMASVDPLLDATELVNTGGTLALNQLSIGLLDGVGWVTDPRNLNHVLLRAVLANPELELLSIQGSRLEHALADGTVIYKAQAVDVATDPDEEKLWTVCTPAMIFAREGASPRFVEAVSELLSFQREKILRVK